MQMKYFKINEAAIEPTYGTKDSAGFDLYSITNAEIPPNQSVIIHTGLVMEIPKGYCGIICPRSGLSIKRGLILKNIIGVIDADYRGEIMISLLNTSEDWQDIHIGDRVAQMLILPYSHVDLNLRPMEELDTNTERSTGGFGSTGIK